MRTVPVGVLVLLVAASSAACGSGASAGDGQPSIVVTTSVLGDVVATIVGDEADIEVIMQAGTDPHDFAPSPKQVRAMREADVLVVNGGGFEAGLVDTIASARADGTPVVEAIAATHPLAGDPHFFTDPLRMAAAVDAIARTLSREVPALDAAFAARVGTYEKRLLELHQEVERLLAPIPADRRLLVTNHEAFGHFADRYELTVVGAVIPSSTTGAEATAADLADLAADIKAHDVPAIFAETSSPTKLADALASEVGSSVQVVQLYSESLGPKGSGADTYLGMIRTDAERIAKALR